MIFLPLLPNCRGHFVTRPSLMCAGDRTRLPACLKSLYQKSCKIPHLKLSLHRRINKQMLCGGECLAISSSSLHIPRVYHLYRTNPTASVLWKMPELTSLPETSGYEGGVEDTSTINKKERISGMPSQLTLFPKLQTIAGKSFTQATLRCERGHLILLMHQPEKLSSVSCLKFPFLSSMSHLPAA